MCTLENEFSFSQRFNPFEKKELSTEEDGEIFFLKILSDKHNQKNFLT